MSKFDVEGMARNLLQLREEAAAAIDEAKAARTKADRATEELAELICDKLYMESGPNMRRFVLVDGKLFEATSRSTVVVHEVVVL